MLTQLIYYFLFKHCLNSNNISASFLSMYSQHCDVVNIVKVHTEVNVLPSFCHNVHSVFPPNMVNSMA